MQRDFGYLAVWGARSRALLQSATQEYSIGGVGLLQFVGRTTVPVVLYLHVLPRVAGTTEGLDVGDQIAPLKRQRHGLVRGEQDVPPPATEAQVSIPLAESIELLDREAALGVQLPRPTTSQLHGQLVRVLPAPALQVRVQMCLALLGLVTLALVLLVVRTTLLDALRHSLQELVDRRPSAGACNTR